MKYLSPTYSLRERLMSFLRRRKRKFWADKELRKFLGVYISYRGYLCLESMFEERKLWDDEVLARAVRSVRGKVDRKEVTKCRKCGYLVWTEDAVEKNKKYYCKNCL